MITDIDDTLVSHDEWLVPKNSTDSIAWFRAHGYVTVISTGRDWPGTLSKLNVKHWDVLNNIADYVVSESVVVHDTKRQSDTNTFEAPPTVDKYDYWMNARDHIKWLVSSQPEWAALSWRADNEFALTINTTTTAADEDGTGATTARVIAAWFNALDLTNGRALARAFPDAVDFVPVGADKALSAAYLVGHNRSDVVVFGDSSNDVFTQQHAAGATVFSYEGARNADETRGLALLDPEHPRAYVMPAECEPPNFLACVIARLEKCDVELSPDACLMRASTPTPVLHLN